LIRSLASVLLAVSLSAHAAPPNFGPNVHILRADQPDLQQRVDTIYAAQQPNHFGPRRDAILLMPGRYENLSIGVGFYTQVLGLGAHPDDVQVIGDLRSNALLENDNATLNFWRGAENFSVTPTKGIGTAESPTMQWAVSQAVPFRRMHVRGNMRLAQKTGWSSGGWLSDVLIDGQVDSVSQQQWISRNTEWASWTGSNWNMVFLGVPQAPEGTFPTFGKRYTKVDLTPLVREKPYLFVDAKGRFAVRVPALRKDSAGISWAKGAIPAGKTIPIERFFIAHPTDSAAKINAALASGRHLLLTPGEYLLDDTLHVTKPGTVVLGLGFPTLRNDHGKALMDTADVDGLTLAGLFFDAGAEEADHLLAIGPTDAKRRHAKDPIVLSDVFFRIGGAAPGRVHTAMRIHAHDTLVDHTWIWRADHGDGVGWTSNPSAHGLVVDADDVTIYGLFVEHFQKEQVLWKGNGGRVYFYQSELPYDPPTQADWQSSHGRGYAAYRVDARVQSHEIWGMGIYSVFTHPEVVLDSAIEAPDAPGVRLHHMITVCLVKNGSIEHVINDVGDAARCAGNNTATRTEYP